MESKYFTPDIEDIRVGYECEIKNEDDKWISKTIGFEYGWLEIPERYNTRLRTSYLTKEQIEAEGWERLEFEREELYGYKKANYFLVFNEKVKTINIILQDPSKESEISWGLQTSPERFKFFCECKCINTFRIICKLLNIK